MSNMTPETEIVFTWSITREHTFSGRVSELPDEIRKIVLDLSAGEDNLHATLTAHKDLLVSRPLTDYADRTQGRGDHTVNDVSEAYVVSSDS